jgi:hypothetical protein
MNGHVFSANKFICPEVGRYATGATDTAGNFCSETRTRRSLSQIKALNEIQGESKVAQRG